MSVQATTILYKGRDQTGETKYGYLAQSDRYGHENSHDLQDTGFYEQIQSVKLFDSSVQDVCQLFFTGDQYDNVYQSWYALKGRGLLNITGNWGPVRSYMLVATSRDGENELRLSYRDLFFQQWINMIDEMKGDSIRRDVDPVLTWEMFPTDPRYQSLDPKLTYLKVHQDLMALVPSPYTDYHIWMEYWIYLYPSGTGVRAHVPQYGWYVDGGALHDNVRDRFVWRVRDGAATLENKVNEKLAQFDGIAPNGVHDVYYLPGRVLKPPTHTGFTDGNVTTSDITIIATAQ
ncbi:hypothetical protein [Actinomadura decatromicini]|uniref:Uncharacterized protein n=1 Tax=Actinomadura decatromicini TaxID=2604572 RepID=A0A5D3FSE1_9ACTN|nr:hypothetical protein [Actinomadura decatromicini]TYK50932.1 hypothetical protein FXF68_10765 [Actinomadura decatromicini]